MKLRLLLYGEYWQGTHVDCISRVLRQENISFKIFDFFKIISPRFFNNALDKIIRKLYYSKNELKINTLLLKEIDLYKPDVLLISKGVNIFPETLQIFKNAGIVILNWNPDDFFNKLNTSKHLLNSLSIYDVVFSSRKHLFPEYTGAGIKKPHYLEWYYIPWLHKRPETQVLMEKKITFVGTYSKRRADIINSIDSHFPVEIWGAGWYKSNIGRKSNISVKKAVLPQDSFPQVMASSLINLNILTVENRDQTNLKIFEILASFGFLFTEHTERTFDIIGNNCAYYNAGTNADLNERIDKIFATDMTMIEQKRTEGFEFVYNNGHAINDRVKEILKVLSEL